MILLNSIDYTDIFQVTGGVTIFVIFVYFLKLVIHIVVINDEIEGITQQREKELQNEKSTPGLTIAVFEAKKQTIVERYSNKINPLIRKKGYILDIIPFLYRK